MLLGPETGAGGRSEPPPSLWLWRPLGTGVWREAGLGGSLMTEVPLVPLLLVVREYAQLSLLVVAAGASGEGRGCLGSHVESEDQPSKEH